MKKALICGISGQDGAYLSKLLLSKNYQVYGTSRNSHQNQFKNLIALDIQDQVILSSLDLTDFDDVLQTLAQINPDEIYNLAGQSSVGQSFKQPVETIKGIALGALNLLEAIRELNSPARLFNAGSGDCFGETSAEGANESTPFDPKSPYAVARASAFWEVANYRDAYGIWACTGILFNHESPLRPERFVTRKIISGALNISLAKQQYLALGNLTISRDWGWAPEYVDAMWRMLQTTQPEDFVLATGEVNSLQKFCEIAFNEVGLDWQEHVKIDNTLLRPSDIQVSCGNATKAHEKLGWQANLKLRTVISQIIHAEKESTSGTLP